MGTDTPAGAYTVVSASIQGESALASAPWSTSKALCRTTISMKSSGARSISSRMLGIV